MCKQGDRLRGSRVVQTRADGSRANRSHGDGEKWIMGGDAEKSEDSFRPSNWVNDGAVCRDWEGQRAEQE